MKNELSILTNDVEHRIIVLRNQKVLLDRDVAELYGVETKHVNQAVRNNPEKFPDGFLFSLQSVETQELVKNFDRFKTLKNSSVAPHAFTEQGLYMLATILKSKRATETTIAIIKSFAKLRELSRTISAMAKNPDQYQQKSLAQKSSKIVDDLFGDSFTTDETETEIELNFAVLKLRHTVKRKKNEA